MEKLVLGAIIGDGRLENLHRSDVSAFCNEVDDALWNMTMLIARKMGIPDLDTHEFTNEDISEVRNRIVNQLGLVYRERNGFPYPNPKHVEARQSENTTQSEMPSPPLNVQADTPSSSDVNRIPEHVNAEQAVLDSKNGVLLESCKEVDKEYALRILGEDWKCEMCGVPLKNTEKIFVLENEIYGDEYYCSSCVIEEETPKVKYSGLASDWRLIFETLNLDSNSSRFDASIRADIQRVFADIVLVRSHGEVEMYEASDRSWNLVWETITKDTCSSVIEFEIRNQLKQALSRLDEISE